MKRSLFIGHLLFELLQFKYGNRAMTYSRLFIVTYIKQIVKKLKVATTTKKSNTFRKIKKKTFKFVFFTSFYRGFLFKTCFSCLFCL